MPPALLKGTVYDWSLETLKKKASKVQITENNKSSKASKKKVIKILHLSDIHFDQEYREGTEGECDNGILCCHNNRTNKKGPLSGSFGYNGGTCDTSLKLLHETFGHIRKRHGVS